MGQGCCRMFSPECKAEAVLSYHKNGLSETCKRFNIATRTMYRWLEELGDGYAKDTETELNAGGGKLSQNDPTTLVRRRRKFSADFKASVLAAYTRVGPAQAARQFDVKRT